MLSPYPISIPNYRSYRDNYKFLRSNDIAVKRTINSVLVEGVSTVTYVTDKISRFHSRTQILDLAYIRTLGSVSGKYKLGFMAGIPLAYNSYSLKCELNDGNAYSESGSAFGAGLSAGLKFTAADSLFFSKGLIISAGLIYRKLWFAHDGGDKISRPLRDETDGIRFFLNTTWRFNFYN